MYKESMMAEHGGEKVSLAGAFGKTSRKTCDLSWMKKRDGRTQLCGDGWWKAAWRGLLQNAKYFTKPTVWVV